MAIDWAGLRFRSDLGDRIPLARWKAYQTPHNNVRTEGCSTQWEVCKDAFAPGVNVLVLRGGVRSTKTAAATRVAVIHALGADYPAAKAWLANHELPEDCIPKGPGDVWICAIGSGDSLKIHRRTVRDMLPKDGTVRSYNLNNEGEARIEVQCPGYDQPAIIWFRSVKQGEDAFQGTEIRCAVFDEELWDRRWKGVVTQSSLRVGKDPVLLILSYAPKHGRIWVDEDFIESGRADVRFHRMAALDNPYLLGEARAQLMLTFAAMSESERMAMSEGLNVPRGDRVWPMWQPSLHVVDAPDPSGPGGCPKDWPRYIGADFAYASGNAILWGALSPDGVLYIYRELYTIGWTGSANGREAKRLGDAEYVEAGWGDSSRPETIAEYRQEGLPMFKSDKRHAGYGKVGERLLGPALLAPCESCEGVGCGVCDGVGRVVTERGAPTLLVVRGTAPMLCRQIPTYRWQPGRDKPIQHEDHAPDALRYMVMGVQGAAPLAMDFGLDDGKRDSHWR